jgi:hypothetical protein
VREFPFRVADKPGRSRQSLEVTNPCDGCTIEEMTAPRLMVIDRQLS